MPSVFEQIFADRAKAVYDVHGAAVVCTFPDGTVFTQGTDGQPLVAQITRHDAAQVPGNHGISGESQGGEIVVRQSQLPRPPKGTRFAVGAEVWTTQMAAVAENGQFYCTVSRSGVERMMSRTAKE